MATSYNMPTPPQPRPGDSGCEESTRAQVSQAAREPREEHEREQALASTPAWLSGLVAAGYRPWTSMYALGIVALILGVLVLAWPGATLVVLAILFGCYLVLSGIAGLVEGLSDRQASTGMRVGYVVLGVVGIMLGLYCLRRIDVTVLILAFTLSIFWIMRGIMDLSASLSHRGLPGNGLLAFTGLLSLVAGVLVLFWPGITLAVLVAFAGAWLLVYGVMFCYGGYRLHRLAPGR